ncbi:MAG: AAA family ATPase [Nitrososphaeria archaeon]|nr:AAA family ATPase [Nitrososphaeria archaeon]
MSLPWAEKYRSIEFNMIIGNDMARKEFFEWLKKWKQGDKAVLLVGPPGIGKNTTVYAVAKRLGYYIIELNASDIRTRDALNKRLGSSLYAANLLNEKRMVLFDEIDGLYSREDYGGLEYINGLIDKPPLPIVLTANDETNDNVLKLSRRVIVIRFQKVPLRLIEIYLKHICKKENRNIDKKILYNIAKKSNGDVRNALNMLQAMIDTPYLMEETDFMKDEAISKFDAIMALISEKEKDEAFKKFSKMDADVNEKLMIAFYSILASNLDKHIRRKALRAIADIDLFRNRITQTQEWRMASWYDMYFVEKLFDTDIRKGFRYCEEEPLWELKLKYWTEYKIFKEVKERVNQKYHTSIGEFTLYYLPCLISLVKEKPDKTLEYLKYVGFGENFLAYIQKRVKL